MQSCRSHDEPNACLPEGLTMTQIFLSEIETLMNRETILSYFPFLSQIRREKLLRLRSDSDRTQSILSELLLRKVAGDFLDIKGEEISLAEAPSGKPYFPLSPKYHFSLSHTEGAVLVAVSDQPIGVDIEHYRFVEEAVFDRVLTPNERKAMLLHGSDVKASFLEIWTRKEAYLKWTGEGLFVSPDTIDTTRTYMNGRFFTSSFHGYTFSLFGNISEEETIIQPFSQKDILLSFR